VCDIEVLPREKGGSLLTRKPLRVFVVDDEQIIANTLALFLEQNGFSARAFFDPLEALIAAKLSHPDLVIADVMMPLLSGIELAI